MKHSNTQSETISIPWYKQFLSYFYLVTIKKLQSDFNPGLCIQMEAGRLLLNTANANYSYGNLHKVFEEVFDLIELEKTPPKKVLILGLGSGSVIDILQRQYGFDPLITAVEIDPEIIKVLPVWTKLNLDNTTIINNDAFDAVLTLDTQYDLIVVDLFVDLDVSAGIHHDEFLHKLKLLLEPSGTLLINYVVNSQAQKNNFAEFQLKLMKYFNEIIGHEVMGMNRVLELKAP